MVENHIQSLLNPNNVNILIINKKHFNFYGVGKTNATILHQFKESFIGYFSCFICNS